MPSGPLSIGVAIARLLQLHGYFRAQFCLLLSLGRLTADRFRRQLRKDLKTTDALLLLLILYLFMMRTNLGAQMRAVGWDPDSAKISGVNPRRVVIVISFIAAATASIAGILSSISTNNVSFTVGEGLLLKGFADLRGAYAGGILIGLAEVLGAQYISNSFRDFITFGLLVVVLLARPKGLMGDRIVGLRA